MAILFKTVWVFFQSIFLSYRIIDIISYHIISYHIISYLLWYTCYCRYYYDNEDVTNDQEFQNYLNELSVDGKWRNGGIGQVSKELYLTIRL